MKKIIGIILVFTMAVLIVGCGNTMTRSFGGTIKLELEPNIKLENITWKDDDSLWVLTRPMREDEEAEVYNYKQHSNMGIVEGKVIIVECKE
jgi:predicted small secreted protein